MEKIPAGTHDGEKSSCERISRRHAVRSMLAAAITTPAAIEAATENKDSGDPKTQVEAIEHRLMELYSNNIDKNIDEILEYFDPDVLQFDVMVPREFKGAAFRRHLRDLVSEYSSNIKGYIMDMQTHAGNDLAFVSSIQRNYGTDPKGRTLDVTFRVTDCFRKTKGKWKIVHEHVSFPIDSMESGKADLQSRA
jgi:ketosteroid isomerase-like protein